MWDSHYPTWERTAPILQNPVIKTEQLSYIYGAGTPFEKQALCDVNIDIAPGEILGIIGHTGSGKSTLVQQLNGLLRPTSGRVLLEGEEITGNAKKLHAVRFRVGLVFQYPEYQLFDETVFRDIAFGPRNMGLDQAEIKHRVEQSAAMVGLSPHLLAKSPFDLSGGEKRRAAIAGVLAMRPQVLILDEPTAGLDPQGRRTVLKLIRQYRERANATILFISHTMEDIAAMADRILVMNHGRVGMIGTVDEVFSQAGQLMEWGLNVPEITRVFLELRRRGCPVSGNIYSVEDGVREIQRHTAAGGDTHA